MKSTFFYQLLAHVWLKNVMEEYNEILPEKHKRNIQKI
jgi:hypothetical protein